MNKRHGSWVMVVVGVAFALRLVNLNGRPLWYDEAFSVLYAENSLETMLQGTVTPVDGAAADVHPLFFYSMLHAWMLAVGQSPLAVRLLSVVFGAATVFMAYLLGRTLFDERAGLATAVLVAIAPFHLYYSQEARMYALLGLTAVSLTYFFARAWMEGGRGNWAAFGVLGALTLYAHNLGALFLAGLDLWVLWVWLRGQGGERWRHWRPLMLSHLLMLLLFAPWLAILPGQLGKIGQAYWVARPGLIELIQTTLIFHFAYDNQALPARLLPFAFFFSLLIPAALLLELNRRRRADSPPATHFPAPVSLLLFLTLAPVALAFLISQVRPVYVIRALLPSALAYYGLVAGVFTAGQTPKAVRWGLMLPAAVIAILSLNNHYAYASFPRSPFAAAAGYLQEQAETPADAIVHSNKLTFLPVHYYGRTLSQSFIADEPGSPSDTLAYPTQKALGLYATADLATAVAGHNRIWFVIFDRALDEYAEAGGTHPHLAWLEARYTLAGILHFNDLSVYVYGKDEG